MVEMLESGGRASVKTVLLLLFLLVLFLAGTVCLFFPRLVQRTASKAVATGATSNIPMLKAYVRSGKYLVNVRVVGVGAYVMFAGLLFAILRSRPWR